MSPITVNIEHKPQLRIFSVHLLVTIDGRSFTTLKGCRKWMDGRSFTPSLFMFYFHTRSTPPPFYMFSLCFSRFSLGTLESFHYTEPIIHCTEEVITEDKCIS